MNSLPRFAALCVTFGAALCATLLAPGVQANEKLAADKNCLNCHGVQTRKIRLYPSYLEVSRKYAGQASAPDDLVKKVLAGGKGSFGNLYMPAQSSIVKEAEARQLVQWILTVK
jgi:cytochrome c